jgi:hypothetical protein
MLHKRYPLRHPLLPFRYKSKSAGGWFNEVYFWDDFGDIPYGSTWDSLRICPETLNVYVNNNGRNNLTVPCDIVAIHDRHEAKPSVNRDTGELRNAIGGFSTVITKRTWR